MELKFEVVDVFANAPFEGNPLAIVQVPKGANLDQQTKQKIAKEFNLSETVFIHDNDDGNNQWTVDIFTPFSELPFAGHPTIGSVCFLSEKNSITSGTLNIKAGQIPFTYGPNGGLASIAHDVHIHDKVYSLSDFEQAGFSPELIKVIPERVPAVSIVKGMTFAQIKLQSLEELALVKCPRQNLSSKGLNRSHCPEGSLVGAYFYVEQPSDGQVNKLRTRMVLSDFEDPATGSAASALTSYLTLTSGASGKTKFELLQGVEMGRASYINIETTAEPSKITAVELGGQSRKFSSGTLQA